MIIVKGTLRDSIFSSFFRIVLEKSIDNHCIWWYVLGDLKK